MTGREEEFGQRLINRGLWYPVSVYLNRCDDYHHHHHHHHYLWGTLQDRVYLNIPHYLQKFKVNIRRETVSISRQELQRLELFVTKWEVRLEAGGPYLETIKKRFKGRLMGLFQHCSRRLIVLLPPNEFLHSSPEAPRTTQARESSASEGGNYYHGI